MWTIGRSYRRRGGGRARFCGMHGEHPIFRHDDLMYGPPGKEGRLSHHKHGTLFCLPGSQRMCRPFDVIECD